MESLISIFFLMLLKFQYVDEEKILLKPHFHIVLFSKDGGVSKVFQEVT